MGSKPVGRELDAEVAVAIGAEPATIPELLALGIKDGRVWLPYSTNIAAAWMLVEKMTQAGNCFSLDDGGADGGWVCVLTVGEDEVYRGDGKTAPLAIVACALAATRKATGGGASK